MRRFTPAGAEPDSVVDLRAILQQGRRELDIAAMPPVLLPRKCVFGLIGYEKMFCPDPTTDAHEALAGFLAGVLPDAA
jgi:phenol 2-monooxygenase (NADPH)